MIWQRGIYAITDSVLLPDDERLVKACTAALRGDLALLQYRDKSQDHPHRWRQATKLATLCAGFGVPLIINDDLALAQRLQDAGFSGVGLHLGQSDGSLSRARAALGASAIIGATCHASLELAERAASEGASYLAFGRFFSSHTKPQAVPAPLSLLADAARFGLPRVAIGGIDADTIVSARTAGAELLATVHTVFADDDPQARVGMLNERLANIDPQLIHDL